MDVKVICRCNTIELKKLFWERQVTHQWVANQLSITTSYFSQLLHCRKNLSIPMKKKIRNCFNNVKDERLFIIEVIYGN